MTTKKEHLEKLKSGRDIWNLWIKKQTVGPVLSDVNLSGEILVAFNFCGVNFSGANLSYANLRSSAISPAYLYRTNLNGANLSQSNLSVSDFTEADLKNANLDRANLKSANFNSAQLSHANLTGADLKNASFQEADLTGANLKGADLRGANFNGANLSNVDLSFCDLREANLRNAILLNTKLIAVQATTTDFTHASLTGAVIEDWHIGAKTGIENIECDFIFRKYDSSTKTPARRFPINPNDKFKLGEFKLWLEVRATVLDTIDLTFSEGIDWQDFFNSLQEVRRQNPDTGIFLQGVEERNGQYVVRLRIETDETGDDRTILEAKIETTTKELIETKRQLHEAHGEIKALDRSLEKALRMATNQGPKYNFQGAQFAGGFAEIVQGDQNGGIINNYGSNADDIVRLLSSLGKLSQAFPEAQQQQVQIHLEDLSNDLKQSEKSNLARLKTRIASLFGVLILIGGGIATATDFANNVLELSEKLSVPTKEFQLQLQQFKQIYPDFDWQS